MITAEDSCKVYCKTKTGVKSRSWLFPDGTTCRNDNSDIDDSHFCVNGRCEVSRFVAFINFLSILSVLEILMFELD